MECNIRRSTDPIGQSRRTSPFHGGNTGSNPVRVANSMMATDRTLIVVPTYNERENIGPLITQLLQVAPDADVAVVDDNSPDGTAKQVEQMFGANSRVSVLLRT